MPDINLPDAFILIMQSMKSKLENISIKSEARSSLKSETVKMKLVTL